VSLHGFFLLNEVSKIGSHVIVSVGLSLDIFSAGNKVVIFFFDVDVVGSDVASEIDVSCFGVFDVFSKIVAVLGNSVDIFSKSDTFDILLSVEVLDSSNFSLTIFKGN